MTAGGSPGPLAGRRIALTRAPGADDALAARLAALGAAVLEAPAIAIGPPESWAELDAALRALDAVDWIAFASANAVERTVGRAAELGVPVAALARPRLAAVGAATAERLARLVRAPDLVPGEARGEALAAALAAEVDGRCVLVPRAADGRPELVEGLRGAGARVVAPPVYRTVPADPASLRPLAEALARGEVDALVLASPSAARSVAAALRARGGLALGGAIVAAIGPTTAREVEALGLPTALVPDRASAEGLAEALSRALATR